MQIKSFIATMGLGLVAGAATVLMMPKHSEAYRLADEAARTVKQEAAKMMDTIRSV